jgi:uncharacterized protein GlcG (DUF336 family)
MPKTRSINVITIDAALEAVNAALSEAKKLDLKLSVAVVNPELNLIAFARADGAPPQSIETSRRKANTSAATGRATGWMEKDLDITLPMATGNFFTNLKGRVPIKFAGVLGGGIGIGGGTEEEDKSVAIAALAAIGADKI